MNPRLINFMLFQAGWFACVLGAANQTVSIGLVVALVVISIHLSLSAFKLEESTLLIVVTAMGYGWDSLLVLIGMLSYDLTHPAVVAPLWIAAMWAMFATTLNSSLTWLEQRYLLSAALGAVFGPVAYWSAAELGAVNILQQPEALVLQAIAWALLMPTMLLLNKRIRQLLAPSRLETNL